MKSTVLRLLFPIALCIVVAVATTVMFWPLFSDPSEYRFFGYGDAWTYYGPASYFFDASIHSGEFPLWNPLVFCGQPLAGNPQYLLFYPPHILRSLLTVDPTPYRTHVGLALMQILHVVIAALGAYLLGRALTLSKWGAVVVALAFALSGAFSQRVFGHMYIVYAAAWSPWCFYFLHRGLLSDDTRLRIRFFVCLGIVYALSILSGSPQMTHFTGFAMVLYWVLLRSRDALEKVVRREKISPFLHQLRLDLLFGAVALVAAAGLSAPLSGSILEMADYTIRSGTDGPAYESIVGNSAWSLPALLTFYAGNDNYEGFKTLSACGLLLAVASLFAPSRRDVWPFVLLAALLVDGSLDGSLIVHRFVVASAPFPISSAGRGMLVGVLPLAVLAGFGFDTVRATLLRSVSGKRIATAVTIAALLMTVILVTRMEGYYLPLASMLVLLPLAMAWTMLLAMWSQRLRPVSLLLVLFLVAEAVYCRNTFIKVVAGVPTPWFSLGSEVAEGRPNFWASNSRGTTARPNTNLYRLSPEINGYDSLFFRGIAEVFYSRISSNAFIREADAFEMAKASDRPNLLLKRSVWLQKQYAAGGLPSLGIDFPPTTTAFIEGEPVNDVPRLENRNVPPQPYSDNVRRIPVSTRERVFTPENAPTPERPLVWRSVAKIPSSHKVLSLYLTTDSLVTIGLLARETGSQRDTQPIAGISVEDTGGDTQQIDLPLPDLEEFELGFVLWFEADTGTATLRRVELLADESDENDHIHVLDRTANSLRLKLVGLTGSRILSVMDFNYPGWQATLDGKRVPIYRAFSHFKAIVVPPGDHDVLFEFKPVTVYAALGLCAASVLFIVVALLWSFRLVNGGQPGSAPGPRQARRRSTRK